MSGYNIDRVRTKDNEIKRNIEKKKEEASDLEKNKSNLMEAGYEILDSNIDEDVQNTVMEMINNGLIEITEKANDLNLEMTEDFNKLQEIKEETKESLEDNKKETDNLIKKKELLDKLKLGGVLEDAISKMEDNYKDLEDVSNDIEETEKEFENISARLRNI